MENRIIKSVKKSLANCKRGAWNDLSSEDIRLLVLYQEDQFLMHEEELTDKEYATFTRLIKELIVEVEKKTKIIIQLEYIQ